MINLKPQDAMMTNIVKIVMMTNHPVTLTLYVNGTMMSVKKRTMTTTTMMMSMTMMTTAKKTMMMMNMVVLTIQDANPNMMMMTSKSVMATMAIRAATETETVVAETVIPVKILTTMAKPMM